MTSTMKSDPERPATTGSSRGGAASAAATPAPGVTALGLGDAGWADAFSGSDAKLAAPPTATAEKKPRRFTPTLVILSFPLSPPGIRNNQAESSVTSRTQSSHGRCT
jgi:hypothetical protein